MAEVERYNLKNPGVKRILQEVKELQSNPSDDYMSLPLEDNIFEWQFAIRGPKDSEFEGGFYHGRIQLPAEYPFKPPAFMLLTPNGRFETNTKICLSISAHHPEHWQPSWSVRTALVALIAFMPTKPEGALGSLDYTKEERRALAIKSREAAPKFGNAERQKLIDEIHAQMLKKAHPVPELPPSQVSSPIEADASHNSSVDKNQQSVEEDLHASANAGPDSSGARVANGASQLAPNVDATDAAAPAPDAAAPAPAAISRPQLLPQPAVVTRQQSSSDYGLTLLAMGLAVAIVALLVKKVLRFYGYIDV